MSTPQTSSTPHQHILSPEWIYAITTLLVHPLTSEVGQHIQKCIIYQANLSYINYALRWDPIQFKDNKHLQKYEETNGSIFLSQVQHNQATYEAKDIYDSAHQSG